MAPCDAMAEIRRLEAELERCKRAVSWLKNSGVRVTPTGEVLQPVVKHSVFISAVVPAEFADIIVGRKE